MNKEESLALYKKGREAWNAWAKEMLDGRDTDPQKGNNFATKDWLISATADFSGHTFDIDTCFDDFVFPGEADFNGAKFAKEASFEGATFSGWAKFSGATFSDWAKFSGATFSGEAGEAWFGRATFSGGAKFNGATFSGRAGFDRATFSWVWFGGATFSRAASFERATFSREARFEKATFSGGAWFGKVTFSDYAWFKEATFSREAWFEGTTFSGWAWFGGATFSGWAGFAGATFSGDTWFNLATFEGFADFSGTTFQLEANFVAIKGQSSFTLKNVRFLSVPDFEQAHFAEAPRLDHSSVRASGNEPDIAARWRALRRLATQGHDHERELIFLAEEIKSLRGVQDWLLPNPLSFRRGEPICWPGGGRYWFGLFYQWFSDFGRSTFRPFLCWVVVTGLFALFYFDYSAALNPSNNSETTLAIGAPICDPPIDALYLSIHNGLVISGLGRGEKLAQTYACLYGNSGGNQLIPIMPNTVVLAGIAQTILSAVLIFLFLLALRNYFRIK